MTRHRYLTGFSAFIATVCAPLVRRRAALCALAWPCLLSACANMSSSPLGATIGYLWQSQGTPDTPSSVIRPGFHYLRVTANGAVAWLVLGHVDTDLQGEPVEVWYSANREVLRLQHGRLFGVSGTPLQWQRVQWAPSAPGWPSGPDAAHWQRTVDEREGSIVRAGRSQFLTVTAVPAPTDSALTGLPAQDLQWFAVRPDDGRLPTARYALRAPEPKPVYGEQCLAPHNCLTWQYWPPHP